MIGHFRAYAQATGDSFWSTTIDRTLRVSSCRIWLGITPEMRAQLFTPFFSTKENGRGIGLTMIQEILTRHGFSFSLDGQPGRPTEFCIYF